MTGPRRRALLLAMTLALAACNRESAPAAESGAPMATETAGSGVDESELSPARRRTLADMAGRNALTRLRLTLLQRALGCQRVQSMQQIATSRLCAMSSPDQSLHPKDAE